MIPLALVCGFLGSGKTSLLRHIITREAGRRLVFVVNELGTVDIDGRLLDLPDDHLVCIPGGSIFCRCLSGEFIGTLRRIAEMSVPPDGVVVETSGIADPGVAWQMFEETGLNARFELRSIVTVVDPGSFPKLLHTLPNVLAQVEACTVAVVNKIDLHREEEIAAVERAVAELNPRAVVLRAEHARIDLDLLAGRPPGRRGGEYAPCADPHYHGTVIGFTRPVDSARLLLELEALGDEVYRAKGFVPTRDGVAFIDLTPSGTTCRRTGRDDRKHHLVVITRGDASESTRRRIAGLGSLS